jgi:hypothetical protein
MKLKAIVDIEVGDDPTLCGENCRFFYVDSSNFCHPDWRDKDCCREYVDDEGSPVTNGVRLPACLAATEMAERIQFALETARDTYKYIRDQQTYVDLCDAILKDMEKEDGD